MLGRERMGQSASALQTETENRHRGVDRDHRPGEEPDPEDEPEEPVDEDVALADALEEDEEVTAVVESNEDELSEPVTDVVVVVVEPNEDELSEPVIEVVDVVDGL